MYDPRKVYSLLQQATTGETPPHGRLEDAQEIVAFPFSIRLNDEGQLIGPGTTNIALAKFITTHEILREMPITMTEDLALAWPGKMPNSVEIETNFPDSGEKASTTHNYAQRVARNLKVRKVGRIAVVAFRFHAPRADAEMQKAGFDTALPDLRQIGNFDPESSQRWTTSQEQWVKRERIILPASALLNWI